MRIINYKSPKSFGFKSFVDIGSCERDYYSINFYLPFERENKSGKRYFDSYNAPAPKVISERIKPYFYCDKQLQDKISSACGWFCIACINYIEKHNHISDYLAFRDFLNGFSDNTNFNDGILKRYL